MSRGERVDDLKQLLDELRQAGKKPGRALLDRVKACGPAAVFSLIEMATDAELLDSESEGPEVWAPIHAIKLLGELGDPEAIEPLLPLFDRTDDDALAETLPEAFGGIGASAISPMRTLLFDRTRDTWTRVYAAEALGKIGRLNPETRRKVVETLVTRLNPSESRAPEDEIIVGFVISELGDLKAVAAAPAIRRAFAEDRVDTSIIDLDFALEKLGLQPRRPPRRLRERTGMRLRLRCTACHYERDHDVGTIYVDLPTMERHEKGEKTQYSEYVITRPITCPKCGAVDQYELSSMAYIDLMAELLKKRVAREQGRPEGENEEGNLRFIRFGLTDGTEMHPYAAREMYRQKVEAEPRNSNLRVRYGNVLRFLGRRDEAIEQFQTALRLDASNLEAYMNLARYAGETGDIAEARQMYEGLLNHLPESGLSRELRETYVENVEEELAELERPGGRASLLERLTAAPFHARGSGDQGRDAIVPARAARKIGRNDPCPCGSGKKYKKCHGR